MNLDHDDEKLESYLRQFQARAPRPLALPRSRLVLPRIAAIAAAIMALVIAGVLLYRQWNAPERENAGALHIQEPIANEISFARLSRFAQQEPDKLDNHLTELSTKTLPDVRSSQGALKRLARE
jgi:hypothetical protein